MTFPSLPSFGDYLSPALLFPYTKEYVPCSPFPYLDIGILFYTGGKKNKTKKYGLFLFFLPFFNVSSFDWLCHLGIWKNHLEERLLCRILQILLRLQGLHSQ